MAHSRRFRFGVQVNGPADATGWADQARRAEELGYSTLFLPDHFGDQLAPIPALTAAAAATSKLRLGSLVFDNDYRHPVVLAKEAATLDVLSGGRLELGLGAGWMTTDYEQSGIQHDPAGVRVDRMEEGIAVLKGLFADGSFDYKGEHYTITGLDGLPKPVQKPGPPLLIGGGAKRVLRIAGREADIVGINPNLKTGAIDAGTTADAVAANVPQKIDWVREGAGGRFDDIELTMLVFGVVITDDRAGTLASLASAFGVDTGEGLDTPYLWAGTVEEITADLERWREQWGVSYWVIQAAAMETVAPIVAALNGK